MSPASLLPKTMSGRIVAGLLAIGVVLAVVDHWAHVLGVVPYLVILACPLMHVLMHRGHGGHGGHSGHAGHRPEPKLGDGG
jgi:hypothetical protein